MLALCFPKEGRVIRFQHIRQSLLNEDIASWRKLAVFIVLIVAIVLGIVHFCVYFDPEEVSLQFYASMGVMVAITAIVQFFGSWFVFRRRVPVYLWIGCAVWVIITLFWQGLVVVLLSVT